MRISDWSSDVCSSDLPSYGCPQGVIPASAGMTIRGEPSSGPAEARPGRITPGGSRPCGIGHGRSHTRYGSGDKVPGDARAFGRQRLRHGFAVTGTVLTTPHALAPLSLDLDAEHQLSGLHR